MVCNFRHQRSHIIVAPRSNAPNFWRGHEQRPGDDSLDDSEAASMDEHHRGATRDEKQSTFVSSTSIYHEFPKSLETFGNRCFHSIQQIFVKQGVVPGTYESEETQ